MMGIADPNFSMKNSNHNRFMPVLCANKRDRAVMRARYQMGAIYALDPSGTYMDKLTEIQDGLVLRGAAFEIPRYF